MAAKAATQAVVALSAITLPDGGDDIDDNLSSSSSDSSDSMPSLSDPLGDWLHDVIVVHGSLLAHAAGPFSPPRREIRHRAAYTFELATRSSTGRYMRST